MAVKNVETGEVHKGVKGGKTDCGFDTRKNPENWVRSSEKVNCNRYGCEN